MFIIYHTDQLIPQGGELCLNSFIYLINYHCTYYRNAYCFVAVNIRHLNLFLLVALTGFVDFVGNRLKMVKVCSNLLMKPDIFPVVIFLSDPEFDILPIDS